MAEATIEPTISKMKGTCSDDCATEAPQISKDMIMSELALIIEACNGTKISKYLIMSELEDHGGIYLAYAVSLRLNMC